MTSLLVVADLGIEVARKRVRRINLSIHPPEGRVRVSAPYHTSDAEISAFVASRRAWIDHHRDRLRREAPVAVGSDAVIRLWGRRRRLEIVEAAGRGRVMDPGDGRIIIRVPPGAAEPARRRLLDAWFRRQLAAEVPVLVGRWSPRIGVEVARWTIRRMTTRWGSASPQQGRITLNLDLVAEPPEYLEYVVVHEMVHLIVAGHGRGFERLMDRFLPEWKGLRRALNRGPGARSEPD